MSANVSEFTFRLRELGLGARVGLTGVVLAFTIGLGASAMHLVDHHQNRDEQPGVSLEDLEGAYHGVETTAPLVSALERGHPETLQQNERQLLLKWLKSGRIVEDYDNFDLGDSAPEGLLRASCLECHSRNATKGEGIGAKVPLEYFEDVKKLAFSKSVAPVPMRVLVASTHAHALALGAMSAVIGLLLLATRWPSALRNGLFALAGVGLVADLLGWWIARDFVAFVPVIVAAGATYALSTALSLALIFLELWLPPRR